jgi:hypothetical protein
VKPSRRPAGIGGDNGSIDHFGFIRSQEECQVGNIERFKLSGDDLVIDAPALAPLRVHLGYVNAVPDVCLDRTGGDRIAANAVRPIAPRGVPGKARESVLELPEVAP